MPTLNMGNGGLEGGSVEKVAKQPSGLIAAMKNAGLVLGIMGATAVTDANGQQVAVATVPQQPGQIGGPAIPGEGGDAGSEIPTAEMIITILKENVGDIKRKFPTCTDEALAKMIGEITLETIDTKRLITLGTAFPEGSPQQKAIYAYSREANKPKPAPDLASPEEKKKLPTFHETKEQKEARLEQEKRKKGAKEFMSIFDDVKGISYNDSDTATVKTSIKGGLKYFNVTPKPGKDSLPAGTVCKGTANFSFTAGKYPRMFKSGEKYKIKIDAVVSPNETIIPVNRIRISFKNRLGDDNGKGFTIMAGVETDLLIPPNSEGGITIKVDLPITRIDEKTKKVLGDQYIMGGVSIVPVE